MFDKWGRINMFYIMTYWMMLQILWNVHDNKGEHDTSKLMILHVWVKILNTGIKYILLVKFYIHCWHTYKIMFFLGFIQIRVLSGNNF